MQLRFLLLITIFFFAFLARADASERYYVLIFGSQQIPPDPDYAHSFATFVKVSECNGQRSFQHHTISWLPETGVVRVPSLLPERGRNFRLHETIRLVLSTNQRISMWGPYEITPAFYCKSIRQFETFENREVAYKAVDYYYPNFLVSNCFHAISGTAGITRLRVLVPSYGETASWYVARRFKRWIINPQCRHFWVAGELGLGQYPIICRDLRPPRSGALWTLTRRVLGRPLSNTDQLNYLSVDY